MYDSCIEQAEHDREGTKSMGRSELGVQYNNGSYEMAVNNCIANNPLTARATYDVTGSRDQIVRNACDTAVTESILRSVNAMPEQIEAQYQLDLGSCKTKYAQ